MIFKRRRLTSVALSLLLAGALAGCSLGRTEVANPDEEVYGTTVVMPPGDRVGSVPDPIVTLYKQRVPNQYYEKPIWTF